MVFPPRVLVLIEDNIACTGTQKEWPQFRIEGKDDTQTLLISVTSDTEAVKLLTESKLGVIFMLAMLNCGLLFFVLCVCVLLKIYDL